MLFSIINRFPQLLEITKNQLNMNVDFLIGA